MEVLHLFQFLMFSILFNRNFTFFLFFGQFSMIFNGKFAFCQFSMLFNGNLRIESSGGMDGRTDGCMEIHPCVLQDFVPFGAAAQKGKKKNDNYKGLKAPKDKSLGPS